MWTKDDEKMISKVKAKYVPYRKNKQCKDCSMFRQPHKCTLVHGYIDEVGGCDYWERKLPVSKESYDD